MSEFGECFIDEVPDSVFVISPLVSELHGGVYVGRGVDVGFDEQRDDRYENVLGGQDRSPSNVTVMVYTWSQEARAR
jgi:hypothetical protein